MLSPINEVICLYISRPFLEGICTSQHQRPGTDFARTCAPQVTEGLEALDAINEAICDDGGRPLQNIRIRHTIILDDPYPDPAPLLEHIPEDSPQPVFAAVSILPIPASRLLSLNLLANPTALKHFWS